MAAVTAPPLYLRFRRTSRGDIGASLDHAVTTSQISVAEVWDVRRTLEMRIAALAAERRSDEQAEQILALAEAMVHDQGNMALVTAHDTAFHQRLAASTGNMLFTQIVRSFAPQMEIAVPR
jgi:DNA-binding FadR family transcriptional regulator